MCFVHDENLNVPGVAVCFEQRLPRRSARVCFAAADEGSANTPCRRAYTFLASRFAARNTPLLPSNPSTSNFNAHTPAAPRLISRITEFCTHSQIHSSGTMIPAREDVHLVFKQFRAADGSITPITADAVWSPYEPSTPITTPPAAYPISPSATTNKKAHEEEPAKIYSPRTTLPPTGTRRQFRKVPPRHTQG